MPLYKYAFYNKNKIINIFTTIPIDIHLLKEDFRGWNTITIGGWGVNIDDFKNNSIKYEKRSETITIPCSNN